MLHSCVVLPRRSDASAASAIDFAELMRLSTTWVMKFIWRSWFCRSATTVVCFRSVTTLLMTSLISGSAESIVKPSFVM